MDARSLQGHYTLNPIYTLNPTYTFNPEKQRNRTGPALTPSPRLHYRLLTLCPAAY